MILVGWDQFGNPALPGCDAGPPLLLLLSIMVGRRRKLVWSHPTVYLL